MTRPDGRTVLKKAVSKRKRQNLQFTKIYKEEVTDIKIWILKG